MRKIIISCILIAACLFCKSQTKKYKGIITAMFVDYVGYAYVNLAGENTGMIKIEGKRINDSSSLSALLSIPDKEYATFKVNAILVSKLIIEKDTFYRYDVVDDGSVTDSKDYKKNCFVKLICGKNDILLYEGRDAHDKTQYYVKLPNDEEVLRNIISPSLDKWNIDFSMAFERCKKMDERITDDFNDAGKYPFNNMNKDAEKLAAWKKLIEEYDTCGLKTK